MITLELTYPPSVNNYYSKWCQGKSVRVAVGEAGSAYRAEVLRYKLETLKNPRPIKYRVSMEVELWAPDRIKRDIDNPLKCLFDALTYARIWEDDEIVDCLLMHKRGVEAPGKCIITLREL
jgi:crossover junction endodeoxyribonuclease RusA